ncbi:MAG: PAS domain-containing protein, partial [Oscillochloris sp.]|nr:PAS domain-containing protein [Oscillochloris sp.]
MVSSTLDVLIVADSPDVRLTVRRLLTQAAPGRYTITDADRGDRALAVCEATPPGCVLLAQHLPDMDGLAALAALRAVSAAPVILLTDREHEHLTADALARGAQDYLSVDALTPTRLHLTLQRSVASVQRDREQGQALALRTAVLEALPLGVAVLDQDLRIRQVNPALATLLGRPALELLGQPVAALWPALATGLVPPCTHMLAGEPFHDLELRLPAAGARDERWLSFSGAPLPALDGARPLGLLTVQDDTTRAQAEAALRASEARYRALFEIIAQGVIVYDPTGRATLANPAAQRILGLSETQIIGSSVLDPGWAVLHEDGTPAPGEAYPVLVALHTGQEVRDAVLGLIPPAGSVPRWLRIQAIPQIPPGATTPAQVCAIFEDITARRLLERALADERQQLAAILHTMHEGVLAARPDGTLALINPAALHMRALHPAHPPTTLAEFVQQTPQRAVDVGGQVIPLEALPMSRV